MGLRKLFAALLISTRGLLVIFMKTSSILDPLKHKAKQARKSSGLTHTQQLNVFAKESGFFRDFKSLQLKAAKDPYHPEVLKTCIGVSNLAEILLDPVIHELISDYFQHELEAEVATTNATFDQDIELHEEEVLESRWRADIMAAELLIPFTYSGTQRENSAYSGTCFVGTVRLVICLRDFCSKWEFFGGNSHQNPKEMSTPAGFEIVDSSLDTDVYFEDEKEGTDDRKK